MLCVLSGVVDAGNAQPRGSAKGGADSGVVMRRDARDGGNDAVVLMRRAARDGGNDAGVLSRRDARDGGVDAGVRIRSETIDPLGARKGGPAQLADAPTVRIKSSLGSAPLSDAGYSAATAPSAVPLPRVSVHVFASEELGPDLLRKLRRPSVTLWLDTRTNMLRDSTLEVLRAHGPHAFVKLKAPVLKAHQDQFATLPSGLWLDAPTLAAGYPTWAGLHAVVLEVEGKEMETHSLQLERQRPAFIFWYRPDCGDASWETTRRLTSHIVTVDAAACQQSSEFVLPSYRGMAPSNARAPWIWIRPDSAPAQVRDLYARSLATQLLVSVGDRDQDVRKLTALLDELEGKK